MAVITPVSMVNGTGRSSAAGWTRRNAGASAPDRRRALRFRPPVLSTALPEAGEKLGGRVRIGRQTQPHLHRLDRRPCPCPEDAVDLAHVVAMAHQEL